MGQKQVRVVQFVTQRAARRVGGKEAMEGVQEANSIEEESIEPLLGEEIAPVEPMRVQPWLGPTSLLVVFCGIQLVTYLDRGVIASNGVNGSLGTDGNPGGGIQGDFQLDNFQDGLLPTIFMVGLLVASPIFASLSQTHNQMWLISIGLSIWFLATLSCGFSTGFTSIAVARAFVGVGEASFVSLAAPFIDDVAPAGQKTTWLAIFYLGIPTGVALGYIYGGLVSAALGWRAAFFTESFLMLPFIVLASLAPKNLHLRGTETVECKDSGDRMQGQEETEEPPSTLAGRGLLQLKKVQWHAKTIWKDSKVVLSHKVYSLLLVGYVFNTALIGALAYWGPKAGRAVYPIAFEVPSHADVVFGMITVFTGVVGTLSGGLWVDYFGSSLQACLLMTAVAIGIGFLFLFAAFAVTHLGTMLSCFFFGELFIFSTGAPVNAAAMWSVPQGLRPFSMALSVVAIHLFGDVPSPPLLGLLEDILEGMYAPSIAVRITMIAASFLLVPCTLFLFLAWRASRTAKDYRLSALHQ